MPELQQWSAEETYVANASAPKTSMPARSQGQGARQYLLALQQSVGNRAAVELLWAGQAKLAVGAAHDPYESEADRVATEVVAHLRHASPSSIAGTPATSDTMPGHSQDIGSGPPEAGTAGGELCEETTAAITAARSGGSALPASVGEQMEGALDADFSSVRLHAGRSASALNETAQAKAFTIEKDGFFRDGLPDAASPSGQHLLAHELAHTIQQGATAPVSRSSLQRSTMESTNSQTAKSVRLRTAEEDGMLAAPLRLGGETLQRNDDLTGVSEMFEDAGDRLGKYRAMDSRMAKFAKRTGGSLEDLAAPEGVFKALSLSRNPDGSLSQEAIDIMLKLQQDEAQGYIDKSRAGGITNAPSDKKGVTALGKQMKVHDPNEATGKTRLPELLNLMDPKTAKPGKDVVTPIVSGGVTMTVTHNDADVNFRPRLKLFEAAIKRIKGAGFAFPVALDVHLPKFGRSIDAQSLCESNSTPRAVFNPPNFIHLSSEVVGNPIDTTLQDEGGKEVYKNLSTTLDPEGESTVVHEMGHMLHYNATPSQFFGLHGASFTKEGDLIAARVSGYAAGHPREFVAEVFLGLVYGKDWDDEILEMYSAYGGPMSTKISSRIAKAKGRKKT